jgi:hypothetical protein
VVEGESAPGQGADGDEGILRDGRSKEASSRRNPQATAGLLE